jgi:hypothetical protein
MWFSPTPNMIEAKRTKLVQNFARSKRNEQKCPGKQKHDKDRRQHYTVSLSYNDAKESHCLPEVTNKCRLRL